MCVGVDSNFKPSKLDFFSLKVREYQEDSFVYSIYLKSEMEVTFILNGAKCFKKGQLVQFQFQF